MKLLLFNYNLLSTYMNMLIETLHVYFLNSFLKHFSILLCPHPHFFFASPPTHCEHSHWGNTTCHQPEKLAKRQWGDKNIKKAEMSWVTEGQEKEIEEAVSP